MQRNTLWGAATCRFTSLQVCGAQGNANASKTLLKLRAPGLVFTSFGSKLLARLVDELQRARLVDELQRGSPLKFYYYSLALLGTERSTELPPRA
jgi:hypothetical protein